MGVDHHDKQRLRDTHTDPKRDNDANCNPHSPATIADRNSDTTGANTNSNTADTDANAARDTNPKSDARGAAQ